MRILVVAMANSIHTVRWLQQFDDDDDKQFYLFPSTQPGINSALKNWVKLLGPLSRLNFFRRAYITHLPFAKPNTAFQIILRMIYGSEWRTKWLIKTIKRFKPDIIHSLEFQHAGYACLGAKRTMGKDFPVWIATNWGSDIYLYKNLQNHIAPIKGILEEADFYSAECQRDYELAKELGLKATALPVIPNAGGLHLADLEEARTQTPPSRRKIVLIKGYQMVFGRALTALKAIENIADELKKRDIEICFFSATEDIEIALELVAVKSGLNIRIIPVRHQMPHEEILRLHAQARCYVGVSISDGISTSMLEAMALGAFPIQTCTSCANEWLKDGVSGFIAPSSDDDKTLGELILRAVTDDGLVDNAAALNWKTITEKAEYKNVQNIARQFYADAWQRAQNKKS